MVDCCGDARTAGGTIGPVYQPGFGGISNSGATDSTRGGAMRGLRSSTGAPIAKAERDTIATGIERAANSAKDLNMRLGIEPCNRYVTHLVKYGPTVGCVDGTHW